MEVKNVCIREEANPVQISNCRDKVATHEKSFSLLSSILSLAGNDVRLKILYLLEEEKELCPCDLSDILGISIPAISQHLRKLKDGNIIASRKIRQTILYSLKTEHIELLRPFFKIIKQDKIKAETA